MTESKAIRLAATNALVHIAVLEKVIGTGLSAIFTTDIVSPIFLRPLLQKKLDCQTSQIPQI